IAQRSAHDSLIGMSFGAATTVLLLHVVAAGAPASGCRDVVPDSERRVEWIAPPGDAVRAQLSRWCDTVGPVLFEPAVAATTRRDRCALEFPPRISGAGADWAGAAGPAARRRPVRRARARPRSSLRAVDAQWRGVARARRSRKRDSVDYRAHRRAGDRAAARTAAPRRGERSRRGSPVGTRPVAAA